MRIGIIIGSTRPGRLGEQVGRWVESVAAQRTDDGVEWVLVDLADYDLDLLNEPVVPGAAKRQYENAKTRRWSEVIDGFDGFVFVTPEYNHGVPAALKNAVDVLYPEWSDKAFGFVGYGADGAVRAVEQWRGIIANLLGYAVRAQVALSLFTDVKDGRLAPLERRSGELNAVLDQVVRLAKRLSDTRG